MADKQHVKIVRQGADAVAAWREENPDAVLDLGGANLPRSELVHACLDRANLQNANLEWGMGSGISK